MGAAPYAQRPGKTGALGRVRGPHHHLHLEDLRDAAQGDGDRGMGGVWRDRPWHFDGAVPVRSSTPSS